MAEKRSRSGLRLIRFEHDGSVKLGAELGDGGNVVDLHAADPTIPVEMRTFLEQGAEAIEKAKSVLAKGAPEIPRADVRLKAPITNPEKVICIGMNYVDHCTEQNVPVPKEPVIFSKFASAITDPGSPVSLEETENLDFEVELVIVIGKTGKKISESDAMAHVAGYTVAHDVSARDWQMKKNGGQWLIGKTMDTYCPLGPAIVTTDGITDPHNLGIRCRLNGETVQDSNTNQLVHKTPAALAFISRFITLRPGDLILTGTPPGVGCFRKPPLWLKKGDVVEVEVDEIGCISNPIQ